MTTPADLFDPPPPQWGLRGDPFLWQAMRSELSSKRMPATESALDALLGQVFERLVGQPISTQERSIFIESFSHGGMSSGHVSPAFWRELAFPLLRARFIAGPIG